MDTPIGKLITGEAHRDAIHVAIAPATAQHLLKPGAKVDQFGSFNKVDPVGIVDPFLTRNVQQGERFYIFLFPNTVTGMRHHWSHPAFSTGDTQPQSVLGDKEYSERWLRDYANDRCPYDAPNAYDKFMENVRSGEIFYHGRDLHGQSDLKDPEQLFRHLSVVLGHHVGPDNYCYSCSC